MSIGIFAEKREKYWKRLGRKGLSAKKSPADQAAGERMGVSSRPLRGGGAGSAAAAAAGTAGIGILLLHIHQESGDGDVNRPAGVAAAIGQPGEIGEGRQGDSPAAPVPVVGAAAAAAAAILTITTTHSKVPPFKVAAGVCPPQDSIRRRRERGAKKRAPVPKGDRRSVSRQIRQPPR